MIKVKKISLIMLLAITILSMGIVLSSFNKEAKAYEVNDSSVTNITAKIENAKLTIEVTNAEVCTYQFWLKKNANMHKIEQTIERADIWVCVDAAFSSNKSIIIDNYQDYQIDGNYYILVRIKKTNGEYTQSYKTISVADTAPTINSITFNGQNLNEINYLPAGSVVDVSIKGTGNNNYILTDKAGIYNCSDGIIKYTVLQGLYKLTIEVNGGNKQSISIKGYNINANYTKINSVLFGETTNFGENIASSGETTIYVGTENVGASSNTELQLIFGEKTINGLQANVNNNLSLNKLDLNFGIYSFTVNVINKSTGIIEDYYSGYYNYSRITPVNMSVNYEKTANANEYLISATSATNFSGKIQYMFVKWDAKGEYSITNWTENSSLKITLNKEGSYKFEVRAKGEGASSFEIRKFIDITVGNSGAIVDKNITITNIDNTQINCIIPQKPFKVNVTADENATMYKFIVSTYGQYMVEEYYSANNSFVWVPNKTGKYIIESRMLKANSYGWMDSVITKNVEVVKFDDSNFITKDNLNLWDCLAPANMKLSFNSNENALEVTRFTDNVASNGLTSRNNIIYFDINLLKDKLAEGKVAFSFLYKANSIFTQSALPKFMVYASTSIAPGLTGSFSDTSITDSVKYEKKVVALNNLLNTNLDAKYFVISIGGAKDSIINFKDFVFLNENEYNQTLLSIDMFSKNEIQNWKAINATATKISLDATENSLKINLGIANAETKGRNFVTFYSADTIKLAKQLGKTQLKFKYKVDSVFANSAKKGVRIYGKTTNERDGGAIDTGTAGVYIYSTITTFTASEWVEYTININDFLKSNADINYFAMVIAGDINSEIIFKDALFI